jgi:hypothetical protein
VNIVDHEHVPSPYLFLRQRQLYETARVHPCHEALPVLGAPAFLAKRRGSRPTANRLAYAFCQQVQAGNVALTRLLRRVQHQLNSGFFPLLDPASSLEERDRPRGRRIRRSPAHRFYECLARPFVGKEALHLFQLGEVEAGAGKAERPARAQRAVTAQAKGREK